MSPLRSVGFVAPRIRPAWHRVDALRDRVLLVYHGATEAVYVCGCVRVRVCACVCVRVERVMGFAGVVSGRVYRAYGVHRA